MTSEGPTFTVDDLRRWVGAFRRACERAAIAVRGNPTYGYFGKFPRGQCGNSSHYLAHFLHTECRVPAECITVCLSARREEVVTHGWLRIGEWTIDITADQFPDGKDIDFVTRDNPWHKTFTPPKTESFTPVQRERSVLTEPYFATYDLILSHLDRSELKLPPDQ